MAAVTFEKLLEAFPERLCTTRQGVVGYRESGSGTPLVLLHGISSGAASWLHQLSGLAPEHRVVAWDAPGYGSSTPLETEKPSAVDYARRLVAFTDALALDDITLVGHSLGALMAAAYAHAEPRRIRQLVLMSPARGYARASRAERDHKYYSRLEKLDQLGVEGLARNRSSALVSSSAPACAVNWVAWNMRRLHPSGYRQAAYMLAHDDIGRYVARLAHMRVLSGACDRITPADRCKAVAACCAGATYESVPEAGHALYLEQPNRINELLMGTRCAQR